MPLRPGQGTLGDKLDTVLRKMAQVTSDITHPDGLVALFNDSGLHMAYSPSQCLKAYSALGFESPRPRGVFAMPQAGFYGIRSPRAYFMADCGEVGPTHLTAHSHADILSFELSLDGNRIVVDPGVYEYLPGEKRNHSRGTSSHNTLCLGGQNQCDFWGSHRASRLAHAKVLDCQLGSDSLTLAGTHDGYGHLAGNPRHIRRFEASPRELVVRDQVEAGSGQRAVVNLLLHPGCRVRLDANMAIIQREGTRIELRAEGKLESHLAGWHPDFGVEETAPLLTLDYGKAPCQGGFSMKW